MKKKVTFAKLYYIIVKEQKFGSKKTKYLYHKKSNASKLLNMFKMENCNPSETPMRIEMKLSKSDKTEVVEATMYCQLLGSLIYLTTTIPDIKFSGWYVVKIFELSQDGAFQCNKEFADIYITKVLYILELLLKKNGNFRFNGYSDADWAGVLNLQRQSRCTQLLLALTDV